MQDTDSRRGLTQFTPHLRDHRIYDWDQNQATLYCLDNHRWLRVDAVDLFLLQQMQQGTQSLGDLMRALHQESGQIAPRRIFRLLGSLRDAGMLANDDIELQRLTGLAGEQPVQPAARLQRWLSRFFSGLLLGLPGRRDPGNPTRVAAGIFISLAPLLALCAILLLRRLLGLPNPVDLSLVPWLAAAHDSLHELLLIWGTACLLVSARDLWKLLLLRAWGLHCARIGVAFRGGLITFYADDTHLNLLPRFAGALSRFSLLSFYFVVCALSSLLPLPGFVRNVSLVALMIELCPVLPLAGQAWLMDLLGMPDLARTLLHFFSQRAFRFRARDLVFGHMDAVLLLLSCLLLVWLYVFTWGLLGNATASFEPLLRSFLTASSWRARLPVVLLGGGLGLLTLASVIGIVLLAVRSFWCAAGDLALQHRRPPPPDIDAHNRHELAAVLARISILAGADPAALERAAESATVRAFHVGQAIISQGGYNDCLHVLLTGAAEVIKANSQGIQQRVGCLRPGDFFGEISLLASCPATADVIASLAPCQVASIDRASLATICAADPDRRRQLLEIAHILHLLNDAQVFVGISRQEMLDLIRLFQQESPQPGTEIIHQGDPGDRFYLVASGDVEVMVDGRQVATLGEGQYFGEIALLEAVPRTASVVARGDVTLYSLARDSFLDFVFRDVDAALQLEDVSRHRQAEVTS